MPYSASLRPKMPYILMYLCLLCCGVMMYLSPTPIVEERLRWGVYLWATLYFAGGGLSALGVVIRQWYVEWIGTAPLASACAVYAISLFWRAGVVAEGRTVVLFLALFFSAMCCAVIGRSIEFWRLWRLQRTQTTGGTNAS